MSRKILLPIRLVLVLAVILISRNSIAAGLNEASSVEGWTPLQLSIFNPIQLVNENKDVIGVRLSLLYGKNANVTGLDFGAGITTSKNVTGIQIGGIVNNASGYPENYTVKGIQIAGLGNTADYLSGIQIGCFGSGVTFDAVGVQIGLFGNVVGTIKGIQIAGLYNFNYPKNSSVTGIQIGAFNYAVKVTGVQIGLVNECKEMKGIQVGLINNIVQGRFPYLPIMNAQF